jgi:hypothetical protein
VLRFLSTRLCFVLPLLALDVLANFAQAAGIVYSGGEGPGKGKHIVLVAGDEEYRSEEALPQLGKILAQHHGFKCTVLFPIGDDGTIDPNASNIPGLEALDSADLLVIFTRFRDLPDEQMQHLVVLTGMKFDDPPAEGKVNDPMMPIAWTKTYTGKAGKPARVFTSTIGAANDLTAEGTRRLLVNACFWAASLEDKIPERSSVELVGDYEPSNFKFDGFKRGVKPADHELK